jgi:serpin B
MNKRPAEYEENAWDAWRNDVWGQRQQIQGHTEGMTDFYTRTMAVFLEGQAGENRVYSPLNVYMALSMLAEVSEGDSREQILDLLGQTDLAALRQKNAALWNGVYLDDGAVLSRLANSLWLAEGDRWQYDTAAADRLAKHYYASVFKGKMGDPAYDAALQAWINDQTDNLLTEQASDLQFDPDTVLALASTICFKAKWVDEFNPAATVDGKFHAAAGDVDCRYMKEGTMDFAYYGDRFTAIAQGLDDGAYRMFFFLPDEGVSVDQLIADRQMLSVMQDPDGCGLGEYQMIRMTIPQFDVASDRDLAEGLQFLGVTDIFDAQKGNFEGILEPQTESVYVSKVDHAARVAIDEEGVTAAAYTVEVLNGAGAPTETLEFTLDRPFMFAITGPGNAILFTGIVEQP